MWAMRLPALVLALALAASGCSRPEEPSPLPSVRLGMSPRDVRERFEGGGEGTWQTSVGKKAGEDTVVEWAARDRGTARVSAARFEFHLGMLVAVRAQLNEAVPDERISATAKTVVVRSPSASGVGAGSELVILARDCPTHRDEAERAASRLKKP